MADSAIAREVFERADDLLGYRLSTICLDGPDRLLARTEHAQPALFVTSYIAWLRLAERGLEPAVVAGHSLGEYSALVCAGALGFDAGLRVVQRRGQLMAAVGDRAPGAMAAIVGLPAAAVQAACALARTHGIVEVANYNSPEQIVISGELAAVDAAMDLADDAGARAVLRLNVSAPFHCSLMAGVAGDMRALLEAVPIAAPRVPIVANVTAAYVRDAAEIRDALVRQPAGAVRWSDSITRLVADGVGTVIEAGTGDVLTRLMRQIAPGVRALHTAEALAAVEAQP